MIGAKEKLCVNKSFTVCIHFQICEYFFVDYTRSYLTILLDICRLGLPCLNYIFILFYVCCLAFDVLKTRLSTSGPS